MIYFVVYKRLSKDWEGKLRYRDGRVLTDGQGRAIIFHSEKKAEKAVRDLNNRRDCEDARYIRLNLEDYLSF